MGLPASAWKNVFWHEGTRKPVRYRFALCAYALRIAITG